MYQITVYKMIYQTRHDKTYKNKIKITSYSTNNIVNKMLELKQIYKDFNYIIDFEKAN